MREDFEIWWEKEGQYSELCGKELCIIAWSNGEYKAFKELTNEQIGKIWKDCMESPYMQISSPVGFARAILKKASEK
jgi:hypothetical protein